MTVRDLIRRSLVLIGVLGEGEAASAEMQVDAFSTLKEMLESWSIESLNIPALVREEFNLVGGQESYTFGPGGDFNSPRPVSIERAAIILNDVELPIEMLNLAQWADSKAGASIGHQPTAIYLEETAPLMKVYLAGGTANAQKLVLYSAKPIGAFTSVSDQVSFPPGYARAIRYNLAIDLADEYERPVSAGVATIAAKSLGAIKRQNSKPRYLTPDATSGFQGGFNIITGE